MHRVVYGQHTKPKTDANPGLVVTTQPLPADSCNQGGAQASSSWGSTAWDASHLICTAANDELHIGCSKPPPPFATCIGDKTSDCSGRRAPARLQNISGRDVPVDIADDRNEGDDMYLAGRELMLIPYRC